MSLTLEPVSPVVSRRPRVEVRPEGITDSLGPEAVALAARAGLNLLPWQADALELMLSIRGGRWACRHYGEIVPRQNGKGGVLEARCLFGFLALGEDQIAWSSHEYKTSMKMFRRLRKLIVALGTVPNPKRPNLLDIDGIAVKIVNTNGEEGFERLDTGAQLQFIARSSGSGRGFTASVQIIDEAFAFTQDQQDALSPSTLAAHNPQTILTSSPPLSGDAGGPMYTLRDRAESGVDRVGWRDWGLPTVLEEFRRVDLDDRDLWRRCNPSFGLLFDVEALESLRTELGDRGFAREMLGCWPKRVDPVGAAAFPEIEWGRVQVNGTAGDAQIEGTLVVAVDCAPDGEYSSVVITGRRADGLPQAELVKNAPGTAWVTPHLVAMRERHPDIHPAVVLDPGGPAGVLLGDLEAAGIETRQVGGREHAQACGALRAAIVPAEGERATVRIVRHPDLDSARQAARRRDVGDGLWALKRRGMADDISPLVAAVLAHHGLVTLEETDSMPIMAWG